MKLSYIEYFQQNSPTLTNGSKKCTQKADTKCINDSYRPDSYTWEHKGIL